MECSVVPATCAYNRLNIPVARANIVQPPSGETKVTITESVRDYDVYILNTVSFFDVTVTKLMSGRGRNQHLAHGALHYDPCLQSRFIRLEWANHK
jgi:phosphoribosylpyrophosphate synthetase